jgi:quercetin dioxygenase-like cupin family protein
MTKSSAVPLHTPWTSPELPAGSAILRLLTAEGLTATLWSNAPYDSYPVHSHHYHKVLYVLFGSITFGVAGEQITLNPGDRLDLPKGILHDARVGQAGVVCLEAQK